MNRIVLYLLLFCLPVTACSMKSNRGEGGAQPSALPPTTVRFDADSAYRFVEAQVQFGARVSNTPQHAACGDYLVAKLQSFGAEVIEQRAELKAYDGAVLKARNIIGSYQPQAVNRILLCAHWDCRPFADNDPDRDNHHTPVMGANDGASGVGVLLEVARQLQQKQPETGIDIIFFDAEDNGTPYFYEGAETGENTWCLGSQYWAKNPHVANYKATFGILLDMVGAPNATFYKEGYSVQMAGNIVEKIWSKAGAMGKGSLFINSRGGYITDDHLSVMAERRFPCVDIIDFNPNTEGFGHYWHTVNDTMANIDRQTLRSVGEVLLALIYEYENDKRDTRRGN
jgi:hypothetical protein